VYFGRTQVGGGYGEIASTYDGFDLTMLEIGAYHPLWAAIHWAGQCGEAFEVMVQNGRACGAGC